jgi:lipopolysaccharide exporter
MSIVLRFRKYLHAATNLGAVVIGNFASAALGFAVLLILTRTLSPAEFGVLAPIAAFLDMGQIIIETSIVAGAVQVAVRYLQTDPDRAHMAFKIGFIMRSAVAGALCVVGLISAPWIAASLLGGHAWTSELVVTLVAINFVAVYLSSMSVLLTAQRYGKLAIATTLKNGLRVAIIGALVAIGALSVNSAVWAYAAAALGSALISLCLAPPAFLRVPGWSASIAHEVVSINKWAALAVIALLGTRIDVFMLSSMSTDVQVGVYASAFQLISVITIFSQSSANFLFPKIVSYRTRREMQAHVKRTLAFAPIVALPLPVLLLVSASLIPFVLGPTYAPAVAAFDVLAVSAFISLLFNPIGLLLFPLRRTQTLATTNIAQLVIRLVLNFLLIPNYGAVGVAFAEIISKLLVTGIVLALICFDVFRGDPDAAVSEPKSGDAGGNRPAPEGE